MSTKKSELELLPNETIVKESKGDCWYAPGMFSSKQIPGKYIFTNQRIIFQGSGLIAAMRLNFELYYKDILEMKPCIIGLFIPTGIKIEAKESKKYKFSIMKRNSIMELMQSFLNE
ncbi:MAG: hypothetical protein LBM69_01140 [Lachnospiraceae bacterium]|jgi:hypothetical protein|nr:hypothetical protein [Lachnospiraceae bacterium]